MIVKLQEGDKKRCSLRRWFDQNLQGREKRRMEINIFDLEEAKKMVMASLNVVITGVSWGLGRALKVEGMRGW